MKTLQPVRFGDLKVGDLFRYNFGAEAINQKIEPVTNSYGKPYPCGCETAWGNNYLDSEDVRQLPSGHICDDKTVWIEVEVEDDPVLVLVQNVPSE